jgi:hypothetical protein
MINTSAGMFIPCPFLALPMLLFSLASAYTPKYFPHLTSYYIFFVFHFTA